MIPSRPKKGFTLLELAVVTVIIGILVTLGFVQYSDVIEKSRASEAKTILGTLRSLQHNYSLDNDGAYATLGNLMTNIPAGSGGTCANTIHYFEYECNDSAGSNPGRCTAYRCTSGGKLPNASDTYEIWLDPNGTWGGTAGYF